MEVLFFIGILAVVYLAAKGKKPPVQTPPPKVRFAQSKTKPAKSKANNWGLSDPELQLNAVSKVNFERKPLMNKSEYRVFVELEKIAKESKQGHRVMAQTSMGEVLTPTKNDVDWRQRKDAFASINSKRLDFAIFDKYGMLTMAIEYQGSGHYHQKTFMRDAVKKEVLRRAGVPYLEVPKGMKPSELRVAIEKYLMVEA